MPRQHVSWLAFIGPNAFSFAHHCHMLRMGLTVKLLHVRYGVWTCMYFQQSKVCPEGCFADVQLWHLQGMLHLIDTKHEFLYDKADNFSNPNRSEWVSEQSAAASTSLYHCQANCYLWFSSPALYHHRSRTLLNRMDFRLLSESSTYSAMPNLRPFLCDNSTTTRVPASQCQTSADLGERE